MKRTACWVAAACLVAACGQKSAEKPKGETPEGPFAPLQTEIFSKKCAREDGCHRGVSAAGGLDLATGHAYESLVGAKATRRPERMRVAPGDPGASYLLERLTGSGDTPAMPMSGEPLSTADLDRIRAWIKDGAKR
jgi:hypothetical protein